MKTQIVAFAAGLLFALGLALAGMTDPGKVVAFLDIFGDWDPSLAFVMLGAIATYAPGYRLITRRAHPLFADRFWLPTAKDLTPRLLIGAVLFGIGWGIAGFCPGPALVSLVTLRTDVLLFGLSMITGMALFATRGLGRSTC